MKFVRLNWYLYSWILLTELRKLGPTDHPPFRSYGQNKVCILTRVENHTVSHNLPIYTFLSKIVVGDILVEIDRRPPSAEVPTTIFCL